MAALLLYNLYGPLHPAWFSTKSSVPSWNRSEIFTKFNMNSCALPSQFHFANISPTHQILALDKFHPYNDSQTPYHLKVTDAVRYIRSSNNDGVDKGTSSFVVGNETRRISQHSVLKRSDNKCDTREFSSLVKFFKQSGKCCDETIVESF